MFLPQEMMTLGGPIISVTLSALGVTGPFDNMLEGCYLTREAK